MLRRVESKILRPVNPLVYTLGEFTQRRRIGDHFVTSVSRKRLKRFIRTFDDTPSLQWRCGRMDFLMLSYSWKEVRDEPDSGPA
jgi:hypothetical protein